MGWWCGRPWERGMIGLREFHLVRAEQGVTCSPDNARPAHSSHAGSKVMQTHISKPAGTDHADWATWLSDNLIIRFFSLSWSVVSQNLLN